MKNTLTSVDILALNSSLQKKVHDGLGRKYRRERLWDCFRVANTVWWKGRLRRTIYFILIIDFLDFMRVTVYAAVISFKADVVFGATLQHSEWPRYKDDFINVITK